MGITTFAAIDVGSYNVCMDIYEMSPRIGIRQIDEIRQRLEIGRDTYGKGKIAFDTASQLCHILKDFSHIMEGYHVESYRACEARCRRRKTSGSFWSRFIRRQVSG